MNRVNGRNVLKNDTRFAILEALEATPGSYIAEIAKALGISHSTASYHLDRLAQLGQVTKIQAGNKIKYFPEGHQQNPEIKLRAYFSAETPKILRAIYENEGMTKAELSRKLGVAGPTISWHMERLEMAKAVCYNQKGNHNGAWINPDMKATIEKVLELKADQISPETADVGIVWKQALEFRPNAQATSGKKIPAANENSPTRVAPAPSHPYNIVASPAAENHLSQDEINNAMASVFPQTQSPKHSPRTAGDENAGITPKAVDILKGVSWRSQLTADDAVKFLNRD